MKLYVVCQHTDNYRENVANGLAKCYFALTKVTPRPNCENTEIKDQASFAKANIWLE